jgi:hypothetical protein
MRLLQEGGTAHATTTRDGRLGSERSLAVGAGEGLRGDPGLDHSGRAGEMPMPGVERKVLKEVDSNIPGYAKNPRARRHLSTGCLDTRHDHGK